MFSNVFAVSYEAILYAEVLALHVSMRSANLQSQRKINEYTSSISPIYILNAVLLLLIAILFGKIPVDYWDSSRDIMIFVGAG